MRNDWNTYPMDMALASPIGEIINRARTGAVVNYDNTGYNGSSSCLLHSL